MTLYQNTRTLIKQFLHNLDETDWISRNVAKNGPDIPDVVRLRSYDTPMSSLSMALEQMGLVRPIVEPTDFPI